MTDGPSGGISKRKLEFEILAQPDFYENCEPSPKWRIIGFYSELPDCGLTENAKLFVAVKTTEKFHKDRLKVVAKTWGPKLDNIVYYSNVTDASIPTQVSGPNTERGHCQKLYHILDKFNEMKGFDWLYVADDDTIFSAYRLHRITGALLGIGEIKGTKQSVSNWTNCFSVLYNKIGLKLFIIYFSL